jgi:hypothetical protein
MSASGAAPLPAEERPPAAPVRTLLIVAGVILALLVVLSLLGGTAKGIADAATTTLPFAGLAVLAYLCRPRRLTRALMLAVLALWTLGLMGVTIAFASMADPTGGAVVPVALGVLLGAVLGWAGLVPAVRRGLARLLLPASWSGCRRRPARAARPAPSSGRFRRRCWRSAGRWYAARARRSPAWDWCGRARARSWSRCWWRCCWYR